MTARKIRSAVARLVFVTCLAVALFVGWVATDQPTDTSAMPKFTCEQALQLSQTYFSMGNVFYGLGDYVTAANYYGKAAACADYC